MGGLLASTFDKCLIDKLKQSMNFQVSGVSGGVHKILSLCPLVVVVPTAPTVEIYQRASVGHSDSVSEVVCSGESIDLGDWQWSYRDQVCAPSSQHCQLILSAHTAPTSPHQRKEAKDLINIRMPS